MPQPGFVRFKFNPAGYREILRSAPVAAVLERRAARVRAAVAARYPEPNWDVISDVQIGRTRARAIVSGVPMREELAERILGNALDAV